MSVEDFLKRYVKHDMGRTISLLYAIAFHAIDKGLISIDELDELEEKVCNKGQELSHKP